MELSKLLKKLVRFMALKKTQEIYTEKLYDIGVFLPVFYVALFAPGIFFLVGVFIFAVAGISVFYTTVGLPRDFTMTLGGMAWLLSSLSYISYNFLLKSMLRAEEIDNVGEKISLRENAVYSISPFVEQYKVERERMLG